MKNFMIFMVGTSGSGKTTIAKALAFELKKRKECRFQFIDGDEARAEFGGIFGYTYEERMKCNLATCVVSKYLIQNGISVILAQVGAYETMREQVRNKFPENYIEIYVKCSYEECARRDVKGYYAKQKRGEMENLNGANDTFEVPEHSNIVIDTERTLVDDAVKTIISYLETHGYIV